MESLISELRSFLDPASDAEASTVEVPISLVAACISALDTSERKSSIEIQRDVGLYTAASSKLLPVPKCWLRVLVCPLTCAFREHRRARRMRSSSPVHGPPGSSGEAVLNPCKSQHEPCCAILSECIPIIHLGPCNERMSLAPFAITSGTRLS